MNDLQIVAASAAVTKVNDRPRAGFGAPASLICDELTQGEFGRRVKENDSQGTDHGAGSCMLAFGPAVKGGVVGEHPSLEKDKLTNGDLTYHTDFRQVYATILDKWMECDSRRVLDKKFDHVDFLK